MLLNVTLGESDALCVALSLWLLDWEADLNAEDVAETEAVAVVLTLPLTDTLAESEMEEVPLGV